MPPGTEYAVRVRLPFNGGTCRGDEKKYEHGFHCVLWAAAAGVAYRAAPRSGAR